MAYTEQDIFDMVARHLLTQGKKSIRSTGIPPGVAPNNCAYRGEGGMSCAVGCLIPDKRYYRGLEGMSAPALPSYILKEYEEHIELLCLLQGIHDDHHEDNWKQCLEQLAHTYELSLTVLGEY